MTRWALNHGWVASGVADARTLTADARAGSAVARAAFERAAEALATAILTTAALCDIDQVVIGGGVAAAGTTLLTPIHDALLPRPGLPFLQRVRT